ncbi:p-loop and tetratricopeptide domains-containing [Desulfonema limicola]|uniref:P-loop and tetratricopeptide domains-containing n=1 Tax=Desulfonema limicola TaxID=45656 RepID=A0A975B475_9BACT|nr:ATP-binding protein [Desulfonema limicola]QTA78468.1 p-loop and tetratricopeptide domains-containing [Desulfonema limicola]
MHNNYELKPDLTSEDFVGRDDLMRVIHLATKDRNKLRIINVQGEGGVGKTSVLREVRKKYGKDTNHSLFVTNLIDFFDISARFRRGFMLRLIEELKPDNANGELTALYEKVIKDMEKYFMADISGASHEQFKEKRNELISSFKVFYNKLAFYYRIIILIDTFELVQHIFGNWLAKFLSQRENTVIIICGRKNKKWQNSILKFAEEKHITYYELEKFNQQDTEELFNISEAGKKLDAQEREKLWLLSNGRPVLLTLALDWREIYGVSINSLTETSGKYSLNQLQAFSETELKNVREAFEAELMQRFMGLKDHDNAINLMAVINKDFTADMLVFFLGIKEDEAEKVLENIARWTFMKSHIAKKSFQLHDLIRDLIIKHVWPKLDPSRQLRQKYYKKAVKYYNNLIEQVKEKEQKKLKEKNGNDQAQEYKLNYELIKLKHEYTLLKIQRTYYDLLSDYDEAVIRYRYFFVDLVWARDRVFYDLIREERKNACYMLGKDYPELQEKMENARIQIVAEGQFDSGLNILNKEILTYVNKESDPLLYALILLYQGIAHNYKGDDSRKSEKLLKQSISILEGIKNKTYPVNRALGRAYTNLGYLYYSTIKLTKAIDAYKKALKYSKKSNQDSLVAAIKNDMAFVYARFGDCGLARLLCNDGLKIRELLGMQYHTGLSYSMMGRVEYFDRKYESGIYYCSIALRIFERIADVRGLALAHRAMGANLISSGLEKESVAIFNNAERHLKESYKYFTEKEIQPEPVYLIEISEYFGLLYQDWGTIIKKTKPNDSSIKDFYEKAEIWFNKAIEQARKSKYEWAEAHLLERLFSFYFVHMNKKDSVDRLLKEIENIMKKNIPSSLFISVEQVKPVPIDEDIIEEKEYLYILGRLYRGRARLAYSDYQDKRDANLLKIIAVYYTLACVFIEKFASNSAGMGFTLTEMKSILDDLDMENISDFHEHVKKALKEYNLERYSMILKWIDKCTGL